MEIPAGWTVGDSIVFEGDDGGIFTYSDSLSEEMTTLRPPSSGYFWWVSETIETMDTTNGQILFTMVVTTSSQKGTFDPLLIQVALSE